MAESNINNGAFQGDLSSSSVWETFNQAKQDFDFLESTKATKEALESSVSSLQGAIDQSNSLTGTERYDTLAEVNAIGTKSETVQYIVDNDGDNNGYYTWDGVSATVDFNRELGGDYYYNLYDTSQDSVNGYIRSSNGLAASLAPIDGKEFSTSGLITIVGGSLYTLSGRVTENPENADTRAVVFYDANNVKLKPQDLDGNEYPNFSIPVLNGTFKAPDTAVGFRFNSKYYTFPEDTAGIMLTEGSVNLPFIPFGIKGIKKKVVVPDDVEDGFVMVKKGDSFVGLNPDDIVATEDRPVNDLGYPIYGAIAGTVANFQTLQFEEVNQVPNTGKHLIFYNGNLVFVNEGVITNLI
tara:strand:- start:5394 stop:6452 length:1059 start_codon:yes stop_codon:yes gene_type:complete